MNLKTTLLWFNCIFLAVYGAGFIFFPKVLGGLVEIIPATAPGMIDMRSTYGGMALGLGLFFGLSTRHSNTINLGIYGLCAVMVSMGGARILGMFIDGSPNLLMYIYLAIEVVMGVLAFVALRLDTEK